MSSSHRRSQKSKKGSSSDANANARSVDGAYSVDLKTGKQQMDSKTEPESDTSETFEGTAANASTKKQNRKRNRNRKNESTSQSQSQSQSQSPSPSRPTSASSSSSPSQSASSSPSSSSSSVSSSNETRDEKQLMSIKERRAALVSGDYVIQVHIIEGRELRGRGWDDMSDPVVSVSVMERKQSTTIKKKCLNCVWDQVLFFEFADIDAQALNEGKCKISVFDANTVMRDVLIGSYEFDLASIYFASDAHEIYRQWIALSDITSETTDNNDGGGGGGGGGAGNQHRADGIQGYLRCSIVVLGPNDEQKMHHLQNEDEQKGGGDDGDGANSEFNLLSVLMPPEIEQRPFLLSVSIYECKNLQTADIGMFGAEVCDPFVIVQFAGVKLKSKVMKGVHADMLCEMQIPVMEPMMAQAINISIFDWNAAKKNHRIGSLTFDYVAIKRECLNGNANTHTHKHKHKHKHKSRGSLAVDVASASSQLRRPEWWTLYGAPVGKQNGKLARKMNQGFIEGTTYRGEVLLSIKVSEEKKKPKKGLVSIGLESELKPKTQQFVIRCDLYEACEIHKFKKIYIEISIGSYSAKSEKIRVKDGRCEWFQIIASDDNTAGNIGPLTLPQDLNQCPDIFVYLCSSGHKRISYIRLPFKSIVKHEWKNSPHWYCLHEDKVLDAFGDNVFPGSVLLAINAGAREDLPPNGYLPESRPFMAGHKTSVDLQIEQRSYLDTHTMSDSASAIVEHYNHNESGTAATTTAAVVDLNKSVGHLTVFIQQAEGLPAMDTNGWSDPYVKLRIRDKDRTVLQQKTEVISETLNPKWYEKFVFEHIPIQETLIVKVFDSDRLKKDDLMGEIEILLSAQSNKPPCVDFDVKNWFFLNSTQLQHSNSHSLSHTPKGNNAKKNSSSSSSHGDHNSNHSKSNNNNNNSTAHDSTGHHTSKIQIRFHYTFVSADIQPKRDSNLMQQLFDLGRKSSSIIGRHSGGGGADGNKSGHSSAAESPSGDKQQKFRWQSIQFGQPRKKSMQLRVHLYQARNLLATDNSGLCDPYIVVRCSGQKSKSKIIRNTVDPQWYESLILNALLPDPLSLAPDIHLEVLDWDQFSKDDVVGRFSVRAADIFYTPTDTNAEPEPKEEEEEKEIAAKDHHSSHSSHASAAARLLPYPRWYQLFDADGHQIQGEILACFQLIDVHVHFPLCASIKPPSSQKWLHIIIIGLRGLHSFVGVHKPYMKFNINNKTFKTKASNQPSSSDPNFLQVLKMRIPLADDHIFAPSLRITVKDALFGGFVKRMIGSASISLQDIIENPQKFQTKSLKSSEAQSVAGAGADIAVNQASMPAIANNIIEEEEEEKQTANIDTKEDGDGDDAGVVHNKQPGISERSKEKFEKLKRNVRLSHDLSNNNTDDDNKSNGVNNGENDEEAHNGRQTNVVIDVQSDDEDSHDDDEKNNENDEQNNSRQRLLAIAEKQDKEKGALSQKKAQNDSSEHEQNDTDNAIENENAPLLSLSQQLNSQQNLDVESDADSSHSHAHSKKSGASAAGSDSESESFDLSAEQKVDMSDDVPFYMIDRLTYDNELEDEVEMKPFLEIPVHTGKVSSKLNPYRNVGYFKGLIAVSDSKKYSFTDSEAAGGGDKKNKSKGKHKKSSSSGVDRRNENRKKQLLSPKNLFLRVYVLRGRHLTPKDSDGSCDPYLVIKLGDGGSGGGGRGSDATKMSRRRRNGTKISTRARYIKNTLSPDFFEAFEIPCVIPGSSKLEIAVYDWDGIMDDLVGKTVIDIEDRWFSDSWHAFAARKKPCECRTLHCPSSSFSQGKLELFIEILTDTQVKRHPMLDIKPPPPQPYELRCIVWECRDVTIKDTVTQLNDLFVTATLDVPGLKKQKTDLHFRSRKGYGSFNWRMRFLPVMLPLAGNRPPRFRLQIWDKDFFSTNDSICEANLSLAGLFKLGIKNKDRIQMKYKGRECFWIENLRHPNFAGNQGRVKISIELMPMSVAQQLPAGFGRSEPNMNPYLPPPEGRAKFSLLSPFQSMRNLLGDKIAWKLCIGFVLSAVGSFVVLLGPMMASSLLSKAMGAV